MSVVYMENLVGNHAILVGERTRALVAPSLVLLVPSVALCIQRIASHPQG